MENSKDLGICNWLQGHSNCPSPHYQAEDSEEEEIDFISDSSFSPKGLKHLLQTCPICFKDGDPVSSLQCLKSHTKLMCYFCFQILDYNFNVVKDHYESMGHFSNPDRCFVKCPFRNCPNITCDDREFHFMTGIRLHISRVHLPYLDEIIREGAKSEDNNSHSSGNCGDSGVGTITTINTNATDESYSRSPEQSLQSQGEIQICDSRSRFYPEKSQFQKVWNKTISKTKLNFLNKAPQCHPQSTVSSPKDRDSQPTTMFDCSLCHKQFKFRAGVLNHKMRQTCSFLEGKFCFHCQCSFDEFSILNCVLHLQQCRTSSLEECSETEMKQES